MSLFNSLKRLPETASKPIIKIVDNGNQRASIKRIISAFVDSDTIIKIVSEDKNIGYGRGHNLAIRSSQHKYHLILNPDVILDADSLSVGIQFLESNPDVCAVSPSCSDEKHNLQYLAKSYPTVFDLFLRGLAPSFVRKYFSERLCRYELKEVVENERETGVDIISGCFMLCRTECLKQLGGFDERYFLYFEDFALSLELNKFGRLMYLPSMKIIHYGGKTAKKGLSHIGMFISSGIKFFNQYGWKVI